MLISTANLVSVLALASTLTGLVLAQNNGGGPRPQCIEKYNVPEGGSDCSSIGQQAGVNPSMIQSMNPSIDCNGSLSAGDPVCTKQFTPNCTLNATATSQTCNGLANTSNITTNDFVNYNSDVGCNNLTIGKPYCVSVDGCTPGNTNGFCNDTNE